MKEQNLNFNVLEELDKIDVTKEIIQTHELLDETTENVALEGKGSLFSKIFNKKKSIGQVNFQPIEDIESESEELEYSKELVSEVSDKQDLANIILDEALKQVNENEKIKKILAQPTEEINHLLDGLEQETNLSTISIDDVIVERTLDMSLKEISEITMELNSHELPSIKPDSITTKVINISDMFSHIQPLVSDNILINEQPEKSVKELVEEVELPDTILAHKFSEYLDEIFISAKPDVIKIATFEFMYSEIAKIVKHAKEKIAENDIELQMLQEEIKRRDDKIRVLQEQNGNPLEQLNRYKHNFEDIDE